MSPAERALWFRVQRRTAALTPEVARAILRAFRLIAAGLPERKLAEMIASGALERLYATALSDAAMASAFLPVQDALRTALVRETRSWRRTLPVRAQTATVGIAFDVLNPRVLDAIRTMETRVLMRLAEGVRGAVRAHVELGLQAGVGPRTIARGLRDVIPLAPNQVNAIANFRNYLEAGDFRTALGRELRDRRFDATLRRLAGEGGSLTPAQIDRMAAQYARRMVAFNSEVQARTAALDAVKLGQKLSFQDAIDRGVIDGGSLLKRWVTVGDDRVRDEHVAMSGETVPFEAFYSNGEDVPGESTFNCRCQSFVFAAPGRAGLA